MKAKVKNNKKTNIVYRKWSELKGDKKQQAIYKENSRMIAGMYFKYGKKTKQSKS